MNFLKHKIWIFVIPFFLFCSCEKENNNETGKIYELPVSDHYKIGYSQGEVFGKGLLSIKDTVSSAVTAGITGFPYDSLQFKGRLTPAISHSQKPYETYLQQSSNVKWASGFINGSMTTSGVKDSATVEKLFQIYAEINTNKIIDSDNIPLSFQIATILGQKAIPLLISKKDS